MRGEGGGANTAGFNWENVNKRILPQLIYKGHVLHKEQLCTKGLFFVSPIQVHDNMMARLGGPEQLSAYPQSPGAITFMPYAISNAKPALGSSRTFNLVEASVFTTQVHQIELAFSAARNMPQAGVYERAIRMALAAP